jgi:hypothetical protein
MKYFALLSKKVFLLKNDEIADTVKNPFIEQSPTQTQQSPQSHPVSESEYVYVNTYKVEDINNHISYLHKKHTKEIIHDKKKEIEEDETFSFGFQICISSCRAFCQNLYEKIILLPKY